jgi:hypothetical protein
MVLLTPVLVVMVLFVVFVGRSTQALTVIRQAADRGARAASMVHPSRMEIVGRAAVLDDLERSGALCERKSVNVAVDRDSAVKSVLVEIECTIDQRGLLQLGLGRRTLYARSIEVIDVWRVE